MKRLENMHWDFTTKDELKQNLTGIALVNIQRIIWEADGLDDSEKVSEVDGVITFLEDILESMEGKTDE
jgi:hypothetical protein